MLKMYEILMTITFLPLKLLTFAGQNILNSKLFFTIFDSIIIVGCFTLCQMEPIMNYKGPKTWAGALEVGGPSHQWITKMIIYKLYKSTFLKLLEDMRKFWPLNTEDTILKNQLHSTFHFVVRGFQVFFSCSALASALMALKPMLAMALDKGSGRQLPVVSYYFIDLEVTPYYQIAYVCHCIYLYLILMFVVGFDGLSLALCTSAAGQLILLKHALARLEPEPPNTCNQLIKKYVDHHNFILEYILKRNKKYIYSILLLNQFLSSVICVCMAIYLTTSNGLSDLVFIARCGLFTAAGILQIFIYCITGTYIKSQMETVCDAIYLCPWWNSTKPPFNLRHAVIKITQRSQISSSFKAGGMVDLDLQSFVAVLRMSFSFFTLMQNTNTP